MAKKVSSPVHILVDNIEGVLFASRNLSKVIIYAKQIAKDQGMVFQGEVNAMHFVWGYEDEDRLAETPMIIQSIELDNNSKVMEFIRTIPKVAGDVE